MFAIDFAAIEKSARTGGYMATPATPATGWGVAGSCLPGDDDVVGVAACSHSSHSSHSSHVAKVADDFSDPVLIDLLAAAMRACDHHGDGEQAREAMRQDVLATPPHLRADLLRHFTEAYPR